MSRRTCCSARRARPPSTSTCRLRHQQARRPRARLPPRGSSWERPSTSHRAGRGSRAGRAQRPVRARVRAVRVRDGRGAVRPGTSSTSCTASAQLRRRRARRARGSRRCSTRRSPTRSRGPGSASRAVASSSWRTRGCRARPPRRTRAARPSYAPTTPPPPRLRAALPRTCSAHRRSLRCDSLARYAAPPRATPRTLQRSPHACRTAPPQLALTPPLHTPHARTHSHRSTHAARTLPRFALHLARSSATAPHIPHARPHHHPPLHARTYPATLSRSATPTAPLSPTPALDPTHSALVVSPTAPLYRPIPRSPPLPLTTLLPPPTPPTPPPPPHLPPHTLPPPPPPPPPRRSPTCSLRVSSARQGSSPRCGGAARGTTAAP